MFLTLYNFRLVAKVKNNIESASNDLCSQFYSNFSVFLNKIYLNVTQNKAFYVDFLSLSI